MLLAQKGGTAKSEEWCFYCVDEIETMTFLTMIRMLTMLPLTFFSLFFYFYLRKQQLCRYQLEMPGMDKILQLSQLRESKLQEDLQSMLISQSGNSWKVEIKVTCLVICLKLKWHLEYILYNARYDDLI